VIAIHSGLINLLFLLTLRFVSNGENVVVPGFSGNSLLHIIVYVALGIALVWLLIRSQTKSLIRTRKILNEMEIALSRIETQRADLENKNNSIMDSLIYAQRIQEALLPSEEYFRRHFKESFILYKPKDIISGDFYWIGEKENKIFIVAADCTGHGVPGALMSMIGHNLLDKIINVDNVHQPSKVLDILSRGLEKTFSREKNVGSIIRDGMDIGLCVVDKPKRRVEFAGAFFPLYIVRDNRLLDIKGDKYPLGMTPPDTLYTNNEIDLFENDMMYLFSDGYVDQFGGVENKKFMYRRFRYLLMNIHQFPVEDQKLILEENIRTWMGNVPQIDDILVMGFKPL
jgi:serine phosphatase RsbU (regulator of sigma subunit)